MGPGFSILIPFPIPTLNVFQYASMLSSFMHPLIELNLVIPMQWNHFSRNLKSHIINIGFSKTHGLQDFLGFIYFWDQLPKTL